MLADEVIAELAPYRVQTATALANHLDTIPDTPIEKRKNVPLVRNATKNLRKK